MKRNLLIFLAVLSLFLIGQYAFSSTTINGDRTVSGALTVSGHTTFEGVTSTGATGSQKLVYDTSPTLVTPLLGTPTSGDATNLTNIPVANAKSGSVLPGANGGGLVLISTSTLGAPAASVAFSNFSGYKHLKLIVQAACSSATTSQGIGLKANTDTGNNYSRQYTLVTNATTTVGQNNSTSSATASPLVIACASSLANTSGAEEMTILNYAGTVFTKQGYTTGSYFPGAAAANQSTLSVAWQWNSTAAITDLTLTPADASNFITGSTFQLYGYN